MAQSTSGRNIWSILVIIALISAIPKQAWAFIIRFVVIIGIVRLIYYEKTKNKEKKHESLLISIEKELRNNILERFNERYPTSEEQSEHIVDLKNLISHQKNIALTIQDVQYIIERNSIESNIDVIEREVSKLTDISPSNIAKMLLNVTRPTFIDNDDRQISTVNPELEYKDQYIEVMLDIFEGYLARKHFKYNLETLEKYLYAELSKLEAQKFQTKLFRDTKHKITLKEIEKMEGFDFEKLLGKVYRQAGYKVKVTKKSGDQGADLIVEKNGISTAIQAKRYSGNVGNSAVQEIVAAKKFYDCDNAMVITTANFTKSAISLANKNGVQLINKDALSKLLDSIL